MSWCLIKTEADKLRKALRDGSIDPQKLSEMSSSQRQDLFATFTNRENAVQINSLFESKLLLKNRQRGYISWAKRTLGMTFPAKRDILSKIQRMDKALDPGEEQQFLADLVTTRLGLGISREEAKTISDLSKQIEKKKEKADENGVFENQDDRLEYGRSVVALENYIRDLKLDAKKISFREQPAEYILKTVGEIPGAIKSAVASLDNSFFGRQGIKTLLDLRTSKIWVKNFVKSWGDIANELRGKDAIDAIKADIYSRPNAINGKYKAGGYGLNVLSEEAFPSSLPEKIPLLGRLYKASESAYNGGALRLRADLADRLITKAEEHGVNTLSRKESEGIGHLVSSLTGRGSWGRADAISKELNVLLFSAKFLKANLDTLTAYQLDKKVRQNKFAREEAIKTTASIMSTLAGVLFMVNFIDPDRVEDDPRSTNFGKVKIFGRWVDITGGMASLAVLASRLTPTQHNGEWGFWYKNSTGSYTKLGTKYGGMTALDVAESFLEGKFAPIAGVFRDIWKGKDFSGKPVTLEGEIEKLAVPISVQNLLEMIKDPETPITDVMGAVLLDGLGFSVATHLPGQYDWNSSTGKTLQQFKDKVGQEQFDKANQDFNKRYSEWLEQVIRTDEYKSLSDEGKDSVRTKGKDEIQSEIFDEYDFKYESKKQTQEDKQEKKVIDKLIDTISGLFVKQAYASELAFAGDERQMEFYRKFSQDWQEGEASYYNPTDPNQTRPDTDGTGAYGRKVKPGGVAFGNRVFHDALKKGETILIRVEGMEDVETPYGKGVFRVDDTMNPRYNEQGKFNIDFHPKDLNESQIRSGRFPIKWRIISDEPVFSERKKDESYVDYFNRLA